MRDTPGFVSRVAASAVVLGAALTAAAGADDAAAPKGDPPAPPGESAPDGTPILRGPTVPEQAVRTLVSQDMMGKFQRVEGRPEVAALRLLRLSPETRSAAMAVVEARVESMRGFLLENIEPVQQWADAVAANDTKTAQRLRRELCDRFEPEHVRDPLVEPLSKVLSATEREDLQRLLDEYWGAWIESELRGGPKSKADALRSRLVLDLLQQEFKSAYDATLKPLQRRLDRISEAVNPTPEQRDAIRSALLAYLKESRLKPTPEQRMALSRAIYQALDEDRRIKLIASALQSD